MSEWLFETELVRSLRFDTEYSEDEKRNMVGEDDKLLATIKRLGKRTSCSMRPTLRYRMGGFSNGHPHKDQRQTE
jgi:hypothetical protein